MINKINHVDNLGSFCKFNWDNSLSKDSTFSMVNILYGRNYSGKTTLSRLLRYIETGDIHPDYANAKFSISINEGLEIKEDNIAVVSKNLDIRVYNTDFVKKHLGWFYSPLGEISPFTILGSINVEIAQKIGELKGKLGSVEDKKGIEYEFYLLVDKYQVLYKEYDEKSKALEKILRNKANDEIGIDSNLFVKTLSKKTYNINDIKSDIEKIGFDIDKYILTEDEQDTNKSLLKEVGKELHIELEELHAKFDFLYASAKDLLEKNISQTETINELLRNPFLQEWVRQGIEHHENKRETCAFCGNPLNKALFVKLNAHFNQESKNLRSDISKLLSELEIEENRINNFFNLDKNSFYSTLQPKVEEHISQWKSLRKNYVDNINILIRALKAREVNIFEIQICPTISDNTNDIQNLVRQINATIKENNAKTLTLTDDQNKARENLRLCKISETLKNIEYHKQKKEIEELDRKSEQAKRDVEVLKNQLEALKEDIRSKEAEAKDESIGAELTNKHLSHYFGHNELRLVALKEDEKKTKFEIRRGEKIANNLSEGECSLISFCYFIAMIEDELKVESQNNKLVIYIDDPISSLDSNHIYFMYSLIETVIAKPKRYAQLFISTHNLDFLKYLKQLTIPKKKMDGKKIFDVGYYIISRAQKGYSNLLSMPAYLRDYITEFNYLFSHIYKCSKEELGELEYYNFGNNARKFLEGYLFFKYPTQNKSFGERLRAFWDDDPTTFNVVNRVVNEFSHLEGHLDRGTEPIESTCHIAVARAIINRIEKKDIEQYNALLESIGVSQQ